MGSQLVPTSMLLSKPTTHSKFRKAHACHNRLCTQLFSITLPFGFARRSFEATSDLSRSVGHVSGPAAETPEFVPVVDSKRGHARGDAVLQSTASAMTFVECFFQAQRPRFPRVRRRPRPPTREPSKTAGTAEIC